MAGKFPGLDWMERGKHIKITKLTKFIYFENIIKVFSASKKEENKAVDKISAITNNFYDI